MGLFKTLWNSSLSDAYSYIRSSSVFGSIDKKLDEVELKGPHVSGLKIEILKSAAEYQTLTTNGYEMFLIDYMISKVSNRPGSVVWDLGAHVGYISIIMANHLKKSGGKVISFEPNINNINNFNKNLILNPHLDNVILEHSAMGGSKGELIFNLSRSKNNPTTMGGFISTALPPLERDLYEKMRFYSTKVPCTTIVDYAKEHSDLHPDIIKIDVEGAELEVLTGGYNFLKQYKPTLVIEVHHIVLLYKIIPLLEELGYQLELLNEEVASPSVCTIAAI